jgi:NitT/TauT family transport system ATP-binding protein
MEQIQSKVKLSVRDLGVTYRNRKSKTATIALRGLNLDVNEGEFVCIVGPSGCGKSTFLNSVLGLQRLSRGQIALDGRPVLGPGSDRALVFQAPNLLPWRTVMGNVIYGMELQNVPKAIARERAQHYIEMVGLKDFAQYYPAALSGGMQQRVNLARALAANPEVILLDEPFAALDAQTREFMQAELLSIWQRDRKTAIFITHQINEAIYLADRVVVFSGRPGRVKAVMDIDIPRPRSLDLKRDPKFLALEDLIWKQIEEEVNFQPHSEEAGKT